MHAKVDDLLDWLYGDFTSGRVAALGMIAFELADAGHPVATNILLRNARASGRAVAAVAKRIGYRASDTIPVVLAGGVFQNRTMNALVQQEIATSLRGISSARFNEVQHSPADAAALLSWILGQKERTLRSTL